MKIKDFQSKPAWISLLLLFLIQPLFLYAGDNPEKPGWHYIDKDKIVNKGSDLTLIPDMSFKDEIVKKLEGHDKGLNIEFLYTMPLPDVQSYSNNEELLLLLYNSLSSLSELEGLEYYSGTKKKMTLYLEKCYIVKKQGNRKRIEDTVHTSLPKKSSYTIYQRDIQFKDNWYKADLTSASDAIWLELTNLNTMTYSFIPVLSKESFKIDMVIIPGEDNLQLYIMSKMDKKEINIIGKTVKLDGFFNHRISAYQGWIARQLYNSPQPGKLKN